MTIRLPSDLVAAGLAPPEKLADLARVAERYAVAITPAVADLIDRADPNDPIARQFVPDIAELTTAPDERADPIGDHTHSPVEGIVHRYPDRVLLEARQRVRGLLPLLLPPRDGRAGQEGALRTTARCRARLHRGASRDLGSDPHRRRSAGALGAPPRRGHRAHRGDRSREDRPPAHAPAGRRAREDHACTRARAQGARRDDLRGAARQPSARADGGRARGRAPASSMPAFRW